jgi:hypothetical protein
MSDPHEEHVGMASQETLSLSRTCSFFYIVSWFWLSCFHVIFVMGGSCHNTKHVSFFKGMCWMPYINYKIIFMVSKLVTQP